jgi:hypothetical protein
MLVKKDGVWLTRKELVSILKKTFFSVSGDLAK